MPNTIRLLLRNIYSLNNDQFAYKVSFNRCLKRGEIVDGCGITPVNYRVCASRSYKDYTICVDYDNAEWGNSSSTYKYGAVMPTHADINKKKYIEERGRKVAYYYKLIGWDIDGDGVVDIEPGGSITITKDMSIEAIYADTPHSSSYVS